MKLKKIAAVLLSVSIITGVMVSCGAKNEGGGDTKKTEIKNTLVYASSDYTSINPVLYEHGEINTLIFDGLTDRDKENKIIPGLAEKWDWNEKTLTYRFYLRQDVKWHDGEKFGAKDVKFTIETIQNPDNVSEIASNYEEIKEVKIIDEYTVDIVLSEANVAILDYLTVGIVPEHILKGKNIIEHEYNKKPIGTGPYKVEKWDTGQSITLVENAEYFKVDPSIEKIVFKIVDDPKAKVMQLKSGEVDLAQVTPKDAEVFKGNEEFQIKDMTTSDYRGILYNFGGKSFFKNHKELPNALSYGVDRKAILETVALGKGEIAYSPLQRSPYNNPNIEKFEYNPEKAKAEIEKLGWKLGKDNIYEKNGEKLEFEIVCGQGDQVRIDIANICAQNLKEVGVKAKVAINAEIDWGNQDTYLIGWGSPYDPDDHTYKVFGTDKGSNFSAYSNKEVDKLLKEARWTNDDSKRKELYGKFQEVMTKNMPYTFLIYIDGVFVGNKNIKGISDTTVLGHHAAGILWNVEEWKIEE
ncbi:ABC transporter substrate-binding protein [uncultured Clostridium sp.]|uniref:ABC transporter substrate-binding protein n=1 Tax=uncultured Clostridium sp. TaxID=59620 RepID=UPI0026204F3C|nr:ABC transporter substrate-binding protein [uncultured Clostridium sp.]